MTSEQEHGLPAQPDNACPIVDAAASECASIEDLVKEIMSEAGQDAQDVSLSRIESCADDIERQISSIADSLETLRSRCADIRSWGQAWKDKAKEWEDEIGRLEEQVNDLEIERDEAIAEAERLRWNTLSEKEKDHAIRVNSGG